VQLQWGSTPFDANGATVESDAQVVQSDSGRPLRWVVQLRCEARYLGTSNADLSAKDELVKAALAEPYRDLILKRNDGGQSSVYLLSRASLSGARIVSGPSFANTGEPGEFTRFRTVRFTAEAEYLLPNTFNALVSYRQAISIQGTGGPTRRTRFPINAAPVRQILTPYSQVVVTQSGAAVGHTRYPTPPAPFLSRDFLVNEAVAITYGEPKPRGRIG
jgi:hypothetical protein